MKLNTKVGGLCASLAFLITAIPGFYQQARPTDLNFMASDTFSGMAVVETLAISLLGAMAAWMIGFIIGDILSNPQKIDKVSASASPNPVEAPTQSVAPEPALTEPEPLEELEPSDSAESPEEEPAPEAVPLE